MLLLDVLSDLPLLDVSTTLSIVKGIEYGSTSDVELFGIGENPHSIMRELSRGRMLARRRNWFGTHDLVNMEDFGALVSDFTILDSC
jgi:hypothetical protein